MVYSSYHVCFIESHEAPPTGHASPLPDKAGVGGEPFTIERIAQGASTTPILFDREEEEEFLPTNPRQPIPDEFQQPIPDDLQNSSDQSIPDNPNPIEQPDLIYHDAENNEQPETPTVIQTDNATPGEPRGSNRQRKGMDKPT